MKKYYNVVECTLNTIPSSGRKVKIDQIDEVLAEDLTLTEAITTVKGILEGMGGFIDSHTAVFSLDSLKAIAIVPR